MQQNGFRFDFVFKPPNFKNPNHVPFSDEFGISLMTLIIIISDVVLLCYLSCLTFTFNSRNQHFNVLQHLQIIELIHLIKLFVNCKKLMSARKKS